MIAGLFRQAPPCSTPCNVFPAQVRVPVFVAAQPGVKVAWILAGLLDWPSYMLCFFMFFCGALWRPLGLCVTSWDWCHRIEMVLWWDAMRTKATCARSGHGLNLAHEEREREVFEGSLEVKLLTIWTDEKQRWEESEKRREEERRSNKRKPQKKEDAGARKGRKVAWHYVFPMVCGSGGRPVQSHLGGWEMKKCTPLWHEAGLEVKTLKTPQVRTTIGSWDVEKVQLWRERHFEVKMLKHHLSTPLLEIEAFFV